MQHQLSWLRITNPPIDLDIIKIIDPNYYSTYMLAYQYGMQVVYSHFQMSPLFAHPSARLSEGAPLCIAIFLLQWKWS